MDSDDGFMDYEEQSGDEEISEEDDDFVEMGLEAEPSTTQDKRDAEDFPYEVLPADQIVQFMVDCIKEVNAVVQIPSTVTRILLNHFKWDKEKLMERYYDGDQDRLFIEAHVISPHRRLDLGARPKKMTRSATAAASSETMCEICCVPVPGADMTGLECGHKFCAPCWTDYLTSKIVNEGMGQTISCAAYGCDILVDDATVMSLVTDKKVKLKYQQLITNSFVEVSQ